MTSKARTVEIAPSILAADLLHLGEQVKELERGGADRIHVDIMDGRFVPNLSFGPAIVRALRSATVLPIESHLMVSETERFTDLFVEAGSDMVTIHAEANPNLRRTVHLLKVLDRKVGIAINPATPVSTLEEVLPTVDSILIMTVDPGFSRQRLVASTLGKIRQVRERIDERNPTCQLAVDGGINLMTAPLAVEAGADVLVCGSAIFHSKLTVAEAVERMRASPRELLKARQDR